MVFGSGAYENDSGIFEKKSSGHTSNGDKYRFIEPGKLKKTIPQNRCGETNDFTFE